MDTRNKTYKDSTGDLSYPAPGCGAGPWDGIPPGHKAQAVDLEVATPVLQKLGLPPTWDGACSSSAVRQAIAPLTHGLLPGYDCVFGRVYLGSPLARGSLWRAAQAHPEVEALRYEVALASALH